SCRRRWWRHADIRKSGNRLVHAVVGGDFPGPSKDVVCHFISPSYRHDRNRPATKSRATVQRRNRPRGIATRESLLGPAKLDRTGRRAAVADAIRRMPYRLLVACLSHDPELREHQFLERIRLTGNVAEAKGDVVHFDRCLL